MWKRDTRKAKASDATGFTLIELMVVIAILGILATIVVPRMLGSVDEANFTAAKAQIQALRMAVTQFRLENNRFPESLEELLNNERGKRYLDSDSVPKDPWGNDYQYSVPGPDGHDYEIKSLGANGQSGGSGYDADIVSWDLQRDSN